MISSMVALAFVAGAAGCGSKAPQTTTVEPITYGMSGEVGTPGHSDHYIRPHEQRVRPAAPEAGEEKIAEPTERTVRQTATGPRRIGQQEFPEQLASFGLAPDMEIAPARAALAGRLESSAFANDRSGYVITRPADGHPGWYIQFRNGRLVDWREVPH